MNSAASEERPSSELEQKALRYLKTISVNNESTLIAYDEEFSQIIGLSPQAVLIQERSDSFAFAVREYDGHEKNYED